MKKSMAVFAGTLVGLAAVVAAAAPPVRGSAPPAPPATAASPTPKPSPQSLPAPKPASILAPRWAPQAAGPEPEREKFAHGQSPWVSLVGLGSGVPRSPGLGRAYAAPFQVDLGSGLKLSDLFSVWLNLDIGIYGSKNDALTHHNNFTLVEAAFWGRYRLFSSGLSPYLFAGPGLAYNEYRSNGTEQIDPVTGYAYVPVNAYEFDFLLEGGVGVDVKLGGGASVFLQGKLVRDFTSESFAGYASTDSPIVVVPLEAGMIFGL